MIERAKISDFWIAIIMQRSMRKSKRRSKFQIYSQNFLLCINLSNHENSKDSGPKTVRFIIRAREIKEP